MLQITQGRPAVNCQGMTRRTALKAGFLGLLGLTQADIARAQAETGASRDNAVILLWLDGGPSHIETYDPKPDAAAETRGPYGTIQTNVPGIRLSELMVQHARRADKMIFLRSMHRHRRPLRQRPLDAHRPLRLGHQPAPDPSLAPKRPRHRVTSQPPAYVSLPRPRRLPLPRLHGARPIRPAYSPFDVDRVNRYLAANSNFRSARRRQAFIRPSPVASKATWPGPHLRQPAAELRAPDSMERWTATSSRRPT